MRKGYKKQILDYNVEKFNLMIRDDTDLFSSTKILTQADENAALQVNCVSDAKKIKEDLKWYIEKSERLKLGHSRFSCNYRCLAGIAVDKSGVPRFIDVLAVFIKQE